MYDFLGKVRLITLLETILKLSCFFLASSVSRRSPSIFISLVYTLGLVKLLLLASNIRAIR